MRKEVQSLFFIFFIVVLMSFVSAGVGIKWNQETILANEGKKECINYYVYNPWPEQTTVTIDLSDELKNILESQESEIKTVPENTPSTGAIPIEFCFVVPQVYVKDCLISNLICRQDCKESQKEYSGEVIVKSVPSQTTISGSGGSTTQMSVSAPLKVKVACIAYERDFTLVYAVIAVIAAIVVAIILIRKYRKPVVERDKEKLKKLKEKIKREKQKK